MNILVLQSVSYDLIGYDRAIDHDCHYVVYIGTKEKQAKIPPGLPCKKIEREGCRSLFDEVSEIIEQLDRPFDFLIAVSEQDLIDAARLRVRFSIPGPIPSQVEKVRDKTIMKHYVAKAGIRVPLFSLLDQWSDGNYLPIDKTAPVILKPIDGASSINVKRFENQQHLADALAAKYSGIMSLDTGESDFSRFEVEEFVDGPIMHIDGIVKQGKIQILVASRYVGTLMDFAYGKPAGSIQIDCSLEMQQWVNKILDAVEIREGAFHLEIIEGHKYPVFLEIAHRVGGARITEAFERKTGIHLGIADIRSIIDPDHELQPNWDVTGYYGWFVVPGHHLGKPYYRISGYESLLASGHIEILNFLDKDKQVTKSVTYSESLLPMAGLLRAESSQALQTTLDNLFNNLVIQGIDEPCRET